MIFSNKLNLICTRTLFLYRVSKAVHVRSFMLCGLSSYWSRNIYRTGQCKLKWANQRPILKIFNFNLCFDLNKLALRLANFSVLI